MISIVVLTYNRIGSLKSCLDSIKRFTPAPYEIIVVNNASTDGTREHLDSQKGPMFHPIHLPENYGVVARNHGFEFATGNFIAQVDDDVTVRPDWAVRCLECFDRDILIGMVGQQGGLIRRWMDIHSDVHQSLNGYVDYLTGFCLMMRNVGIRYDEYFGFRWHEETDLSFQFKYMGYRLFTIPDIAIHRTMAGPVDWELHNRNLDYCTKKWADKVEKLHLEGMK